MVSFDPFNNSVMHVATVPEILKMRKLTMASTRSINGCVAIDGKVGLITEGCPFVWPGIYFFLAFLTSESVEDSLTLENPEK